MILKHMIFSKRILIRMLKLTSASYGLDQNLSHHIPLYRSCILIFKKCSLFFRKIVGYLGRWYTGLLQKAGLRARWTLHVEDIVVIPCSIVLFTCKRSQHWQGKCDALLVMMNLHYIFFAM